MQQPTVATVQFEPTPGDVDANLKLMTQHLGDLPAEVSLAVFPEMGVTGYDLTVAERDGQPIPGAHTARLAEVASAHDIHVVAGLPERADSTLYNDLVYVSPDGLEASYRKRRMWGDETGTFGEGSGPVVADTPFGVVGFLVCYDLNFPEIALEYAESQVDLLAVSAAWRTDFLADWRLLARARALDTTSYVIGSNHTGDQRGREHAGHSLIAAPDGTIEVEAGPDPGAVTATISQSTLDRARERNPVLSYRES